jgi:hypothetical protein
MTQQSATDDLLAQLEQEIRKVIDDNRQFLARLLDDDGDLPEEEPISEQ